MKRKAILFTGGYLAICIIWFAFFAAVTYAFPVEEFNVLWRLGEITLRPALGLALGWIVATMINRPSTAQPKGALLRFCKRNGVVCFLLLVIFVLVINDLLSISYDAMDSLWDSVHNRSVAYEDKINLYSIWSPGVMFISESFLTISAYVSMLLAYYSYCFRSAMFPAVKTEV